MKTFNTAGTCRPNEHYMVDITDRLETIRKMVVKGDYFCINRGRQYGKTTTLANLKGYLEQFGYCVFSISFEKVDSSYFQTQSTLGAIILRLLALCVKRNKTNHLDTVCAEEVLSFQNTHSTECSIFDMSEFLIQLCGNNSHPIVLLIDEVDQASAHESFLKFLGALRDMYLNRGDDPAFQSVILAGVYDIKNLKIKIRTEEDHQYNSPWNIAVPFEVDMSLSPEGIAGMLAEYKTDHELTFDENEVAQMIHDYTSGYPFLVSRICQKIEQEEWTWNKEGVQKAANAILMERNTLFDNMIKKLDDYPELKKLLKGILFEGKKKPYSPDEKYIQIATMFNYIVNKDGYVAIACRLMETRLYNLFINEDGDELLMMQGQADKNQFIHDGSIDMPHLMERFVIHMNQTFDLDKDHQFLEDNGREIFLTYLRPIINGVGNYYIEAQTRDHNRMDVIVDYLGTQYVIELKIWRGNAYNERGEEQLCRYLEYYDLQTGFLVSFCFNKKRKSGLLPPVKLKGRTLIEAIV